MDYEQKYKAALGWMRGMYDGLHGKTKEEAEHFFPELAESEDEKVKRIIHSISNKISFHLHDIFTEEEFQCFDAWSNAWLEKQQTMNSKEMRDLLRMEYSKGRYDTITKAVEDLEKAVWYINDKIKTMKNETDNRN